MLKKMFLVLTLAVVVWYIYQVITAKVAYRKFSKKMKRRR